MKKNYKRGDILLANLDPVRGSEQGKIRPVIVIQNDYSNEYSPVIIVAAITSQRTEKKYLTDVFLPKGTVKGLTKDSTIVGNQIRTIDKKRVIKHLGKVPINCIPALNRALAISLQLIDF